MRLESISKRQHLTTWKNKPRYERLTTLNSQSPECSCCVDVRTRCRSIQSHNDPDDRIRWSQDCGYSSQSQSGSKTTLLSAIESRHSQICSPPSIGARLLRIIAQRPEPKSNGSQCGLDRVRKCSCRAKPLPWTEHRQE